MVSTNCEPTSEIVPAPFLPALLKFGHRCGGTGAVPGRQSHEKAVRRNARAAFFLGSLTATRRCELGHSTKSPALGRSPRLASTLHPALGRFHVLHIYRPRPREASPVRRRGLVEGC